MTNPNQPPQGGPESDTSSFDHIMADYDYRRYWGIPLRRVLGPRVREIPEPPIVTEYEPEPGEPYTRYRMVENDNGKLINIIEEDIDGNGNVVDK